MLAGPPHRLALAVGTFFALVYAAVAVLWGTRTGMIAEADVLFHADTSRVMWNETSTGLVHGRVILHPLHVLMTLPLGAPLMALLGQRQLVAALIAVVFGAGAVVVLELTLRTATKLSTADRVLFACMLGFGAGHFVFASVPETHMISTLFLALVALGCARNQESPLAAVPTTGRGYLDALRRTGLVPAVFAVGALVTNVVLVPLVAFLGFARSVRARDRVRAALALASIVLAAVLVLHVVQRVSLFGHAGSAAEPGAWLEPAPARETIARAGMLHSNAAAGVVDWLSERLQRELRYTAWSPRRTLEVCAAALVFNLYTPRFEVYHLTAINPGENVSTFPAVRLAYGALDLSPTAWVGGALWLVLVAFVGVRAWSSRSAAPARPLTLFVAAWIALDLVIFNFYHAYPMSSDQKNDIFLFAPNLVYPVVLLVALGSARVLAAASRGVQTAFRWGLAAAALCLIVTTTEFTRDLLRVYGGV